MATKQSARRTARRLLRPAALALTAALLASVGAASRAKSRQAADPVSSLPHQFVLVDVTFPYTKEDADNSKPNQSHFYVKTPPGLNPDRPKDWTTPVDFRNGTVHIRTEVLERPDSGEGTQWSLCYIPYKGQGNGYGCTGTPVYKTTGVFEKDVPMTSFWENQSILWDQGIKQVDIVMKDSHGVKVHTLPDPEKYLPTKVRITMVQVAAGAKYDPNLVPGLPHEGGADTDPGHK